MNAIIALCHFCELHGPSVLFCTQSFHDADDPQKVLEIVPDLPKNRKKYYGTADIFRRSVSTDRSNLTTSTESNASASDNSDHGVKGKNTLSDTCEACRSIPPGLSGYVCNDHDAQVSYIGSQYPFHPEIFSIVRQACVRSLSCEVCPGREGPIFFGDENRGHVYSHTFFLKDSQARGFQRWYSIIVVMMDKIFLLNSWPFLTKHLRTVIDELQDKANKVYQVEQTECPQRMVRLNSVTGMTPGNFRRQRGSSKSMRSLQELTNDKDVYASLHLWFTWILKAGGNRMTEKLLEGPLTEDTVIDLEKQEETKEGFVMIYTKKVTKDSKVVASPTANVSEVEVKAAKMKVNSIRHLWKVLGKEKFHLVAYNVIIGNQIILLCDDKDLTSSIVYQLKILLPRGCVNDIPYSDVYIDSWKCNFLGLPKTTTLPPHVLLSELHFIIEITPKDEKSSFSDDPLNFHYNINGDFEVPNKGPSILYRMEKVIENEEFTERVLDIYFMTLKEEWMNKVKVLFKFSRAGSRSVDDTQKLLQVLGTGDRDKQVLKFWMTGLSVQFKIHVLSATMSQCHTNDCSTATT